VASPSMSARSSARVKAWDRALGDGPRRCSATAPERGHQPDHGQPWAAAFPTKYLKDVPPVVTYGPLDLPRAGASTSATRFPETIIEPGSRQWWATPGIIESEVVLISKEERRGRGAPGSIWTIGKFGGLAETMGTSSIRYAIRTPHDGAEHDARACSQGPTCDSADVLYEKKPVSAFR